MIKINNGNGAFLMTSQNTQTTTKNSFLVVNYKTYFNGSIGFIQSYVNDEIMNTIMSNVQEDSEFTSNILNELTNQYIAKLQLLNPSITFVNTL